MRRMVGVICERLMWDYESIDRRDQERERE